MKFAPYFHVFTRKLSFLLVCFFAASLRAEPPDPENYIVVNGGFVQLAQGAWIEGSSKAGGEQPDFLVDLKDPRLKPLLDFCHTLRKEPSSKENKIKRVVEFIKSHVIIEDRNGGYTELLANAKAENRPVLLGEYAGVKAGSCRESSLLLHLALLETGIPNFRVYGRMNTGYGVEHGTIVAVVNGDLRTFDTYNADYHDKSLTELIGSGKVSGALPHPIYWIPKSAIDSRKKPLSTKMTLPELEQLAKETVRKIPDLATLWEWRERTGNEIYLGGGLTRGLLHWLRFNLDRMPLDEVKQLPVPTTSDLLLQSNSDKDIYASAQTIEHLRRDLPAFKKWDISDLDSFNESADAGGVSLDKTLIGPGGTRDSLQGLKDYHEGQLRFVEIPDDKAKATYWFKEKGNSKTAMALRFLRVQLDLPELTPTADSEAAIRAIAIRETPTLGDAHRWWLEKGLTKLLVASKYDSVEVVRLLREYEMLEAIAAQKLTVPSLDSIDTIRARLGIKKLAPGEEAALQKLLAHDLGKTSPSSDPGLIRGALLASTSAREYLGRSPPIDGYLGALTKERLDTAHSETIDHFLSLKPTPGELDDWYGHLYSFDFDTVLLEKRLLQAATAKEFVDYMRDVNDLAKEQRARFEVVYQKLAPYFVTLGPTPDDLDRSYSMNESYEWDYLALRGALMGAKTASQYAALMRKNGNFPVAGANVEFDKIYAETMDHLVSLDPQPKDLRTWEENTAATTLDVQLLEKVLMRAKTAPAFTALLRDIASWNGDSGKEYRGMLIRMMPMFMALGPTQSDARAFARKTGWSADVFTGPFQPEPARAGFRKGCQLALSYLSFGLVPRP